MRLGLEAVCLGGLVLEGRERFFFLAMFASSGVSSVGWRLRLVVVDPGMYMSNVRLALNGLYLLAVCGPICDDPAVAWIWSLSLSSENRVSDDTAGVRVTCVELTCLGRVERLGRRFNCGSIWVCEGGGYEWMG